MSTESPFVPRRFNWVEFYIILGVIMAALAAFVPYSLTQQGGALAESELPMPLPLVVIAQILQNSVFYALLSGLGLYLACQSGLRLPILEGWLRDQPVRGKIKNILVPSVLLGLSAGIVLTLHQALFIPPSARDAAAPIWQAVLASIYRGITEEVLLRLFVMSLIVWIGGLLMRDSDGRPARITFWIAIVLAAIVPGIGNLPLIGAVLLNGLAGAAFGWLYWKFGLESAMLAHFTGDIVLHVIAPLLSPG